MHSTLIVARIADGAGEAVARLFTDFDGTDMPHLMGTRRRQLFTYKGLYFHLQDFDSDHGGEQIERAKDEPLFKQISDDLRPYIQPYDPNWRTPSDAVATRIYHWDPS